MIITLCGSARFEQLYHEWNEKLTLAGHIVFSLAVFPSFKNGNKDWYDEKIKTTLDLAHLAKINHSDAIVVVSEEGYIGDSTRREVEWAHMMGKKVYITDYLISPHIPDADHALLLTSQAVP